MNNSGTGCLACKDCTDRRVGCHNSSCPAWAEHEAAKPGRYAQNLRKSQNNLDTSASILRHQRSEGRRGKMGQ